MNHNNQPIWIMGLTASGKSDLAFNFAQKIDGEIISVDSALVYKNLNIGTAKPSKKELESVTHHLINICEVWQIYDVAQFCQDSAKISQQILSRAKKPILSGGTFMYFRSLEQGINRLPKSDKNLQNNWQQEHETKGNDYLYNQLKKIDPIWAQKVHINDTQRIIRALVIYQQTGKKISALLQDSCKISTNLPKPIKIALAPQKENLKQKIALRFHQMLECGLIKEVENILVNLNKMNIDKSQYLNLPSLKSIGYKQVIDYLLGNYDYKTMIEKAIIATNQLAKRQRTWLRSEKDILIFKDSNSALQYLLNLK